ncbi:OLC1v1015754C1 [Oldenlandia corymbosa var. corymbosa]|uniref:OLC1v1015754C1 n=1 Tax=Oldenlandia corymbosa var. corymbosa TaxID=529605 RepID=A0AAV1E6X9_OLDCO|nr:OLC1v1015754C1 [Oldenlandia corymbosa var. corymbosa]
MVFVSEDGSISPAMETPLLFKEDDDMVEGNVDYKGRPVRRSKSGGWLSASFIIGVEMAEYFAYYGISANLITYLTGPLGQSTATAAENVNAWSGTSQLLPLLGAFVADTYLGRYRTIIVASVLYILALGLLTLSAVIPSLGSFNCHNASNSSSIPCPPPQIQVTTFFFSLYLMAIAQGMHKPCVHAFGADQFDGSDIEECKAKSSFFNWCGVGTCVAITLTIMILTYIQDYYSWGVGFGIPCLVMVFALVWFLLGTVTYRFHVKCAETQPVSRIGRVFVKAVKNWRITSSALCMDMESQDVLPYLGSQQFKFLDRALFAPEGSMREGKVCSISEVEEAKAVLRLFPIWLSCLVYGIVYSQPPTLFTKQGLTMDRFITPNFEVPAASLQVFSSITVIIFLCVYDRVLVPVARAITGIPTGITMLQRIGTGIFFSILSILVAALVERKRLEIAQEKGLVGYPFQVVPMSVAWLIPQYLLLGVSQSFTITGLQEFFYDQVPSDLKSIGLALYFTIFGVGSFLSGILISVIESATSGNGNESWFSDNVVKGHLDYFYWLLTGLSAVTFIAFVYFAKAYHYRSRCQTYVS